MRRLRVVIGAVIAVCALGALAVPAFAKEKLVFGTFVASVTGKTLSETNTAAVKQNKEDEAELTGLQIGQYKFGRANKEKGIFEYESPCLKPPKVTGVVTAERSSSLLTEVAFKECVNGSIEHGNLGWKSNSFKLAIRFKSNESAEIGKTAENGIEIAKKTAGEI